MKICIYGPKLLLKNIKLHNKIRSLEAKLKKINRRKTCLSELKKKIELDLKEFRQKMSKLRLEQNEQWKEKNKEFINKSKNVVSQKWFRNLRLSNPKKFRIQRLLVYARQRAKEKKWDFNLDKDWCEEKIDKKCAATGLPFDLSVEGTYIKMNSYAPSIDRIDRNKGYIKNNCQMVIWAYNRTKCEFDDKTVYEILKVFVEKFKPSNTL